MSVRVILIFAVGGLISAVATVLLLKAEANVDHLTSQEKPTLETASTNTYNKQVLSANVPSSKASDNTVLLDQAISLIEAKYPQLNHLSHKFRPDLVDSVLQEQRRYEEEGHPVHVALQFAVDFVLANEAHELSLKLIKLESLESQHRTSINAAAREARVLVHTAHLDAQIQNAISNKDAREAERLIFERTNYAIATIETELNQRQQLAELNQRRQLAELNQRQQLLNAVQANQSAQIPIAHFGNASPPANQGAVNTRTGEFLAPAGNNLVGTRDGRLYVPSGPNGYTDTRTGRFVVAN
ncbi:MAG: hypothetical protein CTY39_11825 [Hyphomicrobium sp.]|nr:MAG: hypothetical protein CTY39_11825 [Hyphomicrobium sp.]